MKPFFFPSSSISFSPQPSFRCSFSGGEKNTNHADDYSSEDSDGPRPASAKAASATTTKKQRKKRKSGGGQEGGDEQQQQPKRREGKKAAAAAASAAAAAAGARKEEDQGQQQEEEEEPERWVQCDRCLRWRVVPDEHWPGVEADPRPHWFCEWARWDVRGQVPFEAACPQR